MEHRMSQGRPWVLHEDGTQETTPQAMEEQLDPDTLLEKVFETPGYQGEALDSLLEMVKSNEIRDYGEEFTETTYKRCFDLLVVAWKDGRSDLIQAVEWVVSYVVAMPEFDKDKARPEVTSPEFVRAVVGRFEVAEQREYRFLRELLHFLYSEFPETRRLVRALIGRFLIGFTKVWDKHMAVAPMLEVLGQIIKGFRLPLTSVHKALLVTGLLPLHKSNEMYEWRDQIPLLELYHEPLVFCIRQFLDLDRSLAVPVVEALLKAWPEGFESNSPKEVLCLHEMEGLLKYLTDDDFTKVLPSLLPRLSRCLKTEHSRNLEKVLHLWKDPTFVEFNKKFSMAIIPALMPNIYRHGEVHWNVTVNKTRALVLDILHEADPVTFARVAASIIGHSATPPDPLAPSDTHAPSSHPPAEAAPHPHHHFGPPKNLFRAGAGGWKPPTRGGKPGEAPPVTITGVAPWAMGQQQQPRMASLGAKPQPPVTITGVAPWAMGEAPGPSLFRAGMKQQPAGRAGMMPPPAKRPMVTEPKRPVVKQPEEEAARPEEQQLQEEEDGVRSGLMTSSGRLIDEAVMEEDEEEEEEGEGDEEEERRPAKAQAKEAVAEAEAEELRRDSKAGMGGGAAAAKAAEKEGVASMEVDVGDVESSEAVQKILDFIKKLRPEGPAKDGGKSWHEIQLEATPTLLPDLKFHDLVFGQDLGSGAFSTVKYARLITKGKTRSEWPEYAVKVISTTRIEELGYEGSVSREIAVLRLLSHPGIARMVSAFRWRDGAYLVLEYASKGDLHTHIVTNGSLSEESTRFVVGEVIAALKSVHDAGFVYGDLKPENVVITESGHVKITDFGACRPVSEAARRVLRDSKGIVKRLRDGDWRAASGKQAQQKQQDEEAVKMQEDKEEKQGGEDDDDNEEEEDERIEGTYAYLPPEVIRDGVLPDQQADAWALGCLLYHCVAGRPPIFANMGEDVRARVVTFALEDGLRPLLEESGVSDEVKALLQGLLSTDKGRRFTVEAAGVQGFFTNHGVDVYALHRGPAVPFATGAAAPNPEAAWNRRQFSAIWAPLPGNYSFASSSYSLSVVPEGDEEYGSPFSYDTYRIKEESRGPPLPRK